MTRFIEQLANWYFARKALPYIYVCLLDCIIVFFITLMAAVFNEGALFSLTHFPQVMLSCFLVVVCSVVGFRIMHTYSGVLRFSTYVDLLKVGVAFLIAFVLSVFISLMLGGLFHLAFFNVRNLIEIFLFSTGALWTERLAVKVLFDHFFKKENVRNVFIYGTGAAAVGLAKTLSNQKPTRFNLKGFMDAREDFIDKHLMGVQVHKADHTVFEVMRRKGVEDIIVSPLRNEEFRNNTALQDELLRNGIHIFMMPTITDWDPDEGHSATAQIKEVEIEDLLPRDQIQVDMDGIGKLLTGQTILITGSAGSIGSEMVRQIAVYKPKRLILIDQAETPQHDIRLMMARQWPEIEAHTIVTSIAHQKRMEEIFRTYRPDYIFHAAAYKHVPMMEDNPAEAILNNVASTCIMADLAVKYGTKKFVMISTDKAVNPTNVMGCSKRICEIYVQSLNHALHNGETLCDAPEREYGIGSTDLPETATHTQFITTRFGNVLGSNGSVVPLFREQIRNGGPVTVTHPDIIRYFMLIPEACKLVLEAGTMGNGGEIFVFDMGKPVKIADLAKRMISLSGAKNVEIKYTGLRDGEKLYEELLNDEEQSKPTFHEKIKIAQVREYSYNEACTKLNDLISIARTYDDMAIVKKMKEIVPEFKSKHSKYEVLD